MAHLQAALNSIMLTGQCAMSEAQNKMRQRAFKVRACAVWVSVEMAASHAVLRQAKHKAKKRASQTQLNVEPPPCSVVHPEPENEYHSEDSVLGHGALLCPPLHLGLLQRA